MFNKSTVRVVLYSLFFTPNAYGFGGAVKWNTQNQVSIDLGTNIQQQNYATHPSGWYSFLHVGASYTYTTPFFNQYNIQVDKVLGSSLSVETLDFPYQGWYSPVQINFPSLLAGIVINHRWSVLASYTLSWQPLFVFGNDNISMGNDRFAIKFSRLNTDSETDDESGVNNLASQDDQAKNTDYFHSWRPFVVLYANHQPCINNCAMNFPNVINTIGYSATGMILGIEKPILGF
jgi:hypothetical protein